MSLDLLVHDIADRCRSAGPFLVAMSGGVDSSLVAAAAYRALGERCVAVTVRSELTVPRDFTRAVELAEHIGIKHHSTLFQALENPSLRGNATDRCYHCKRAIFDLMKRGYGEDCRILDGTNSDDDPARPGLRAVNEFNVLSPLKEAGMGKEVVRMIARGAGLPSWDRPSESCLATRIKAGVELTEKGLAQVRAMESFFHEQGVETLRAYHDNLVATVVCLPQYIDILNKSRDAFAALIKRIGLRSFVFKEFDSES